MRVKFTRQQQQRIDALIERRLIQERRAHRHELTRLRRSLDQALACNEVLADALERQDSENLRLRSRLARIERFSGDGWQLWFARVGGRSSLPSPTRQRNNNEED